MSNANMDNLSKFFFFKKKFLYGCVDGMQMKLLLLNVIFAIRWYVYLHVKKRFFFLTL